MDELPICFAFDVDETLDISAGPVPLRVLAELAAAGHIVGLCGNYAMVTMNVQHWWKFISFIGQMTMDKAAFLLQIKTYCPASAYVMVGNIKGVTGASDDEGAAQRAGWQFISEAEFIKRYNARILIATALPPRGPIT